MAFKSKLNLKSPIFDKTARERAVRNAVREAADDFVEMIQTAMETSPHTGKTVTKTRGGNFRVRHTQSKRGQRPAPFTGELLRSVKRRKKSDTHQTVDVDAEYAEHLVNLGRKVVTDADRAKGQTNLNRKINKAISSLL